ncbi:hypothetical protein ACFQMM_05005 [Saliphagus sp. GCM10025308]
MVHTPDSSARLSRLYRLEAESVVLHEMTTSVREAAREREPEPRQERR